MHSVLKIVASAVITVSLMHVSAFGQTSPANKDTIVAECLVGPCELAIAAAVVDMTTTEKDQFLAEVVAALAEAAQTDPTKTSQAVAAIDATKGLFTDKSRAEQATTITQALSTGGNIDTAALGIQGSGN